MELRLVNNAALCSYDCHSQASCLQGHLDALNWRAAIYLYEKNQLTFMKGRAATTSMRVPYAAMIVLSKQIEDISDKYRLSNVAR